MSEGLKKSKLGAATLIPPNGYSVLPAYKEKDGIILVTEVAVYVGAGGTSCRADFQLNSIRCRSLFTSDAARFDHTRMLFLDVLSGMLNDEALMHFCNVTRSWTLDEAAVPDAGNSPKPLDEMSPALPLHVKPSAEVIRKGTSLSVPLDETFDRFRDTRALVVW